MGLVMVRWLINSRWGQLSLSGSRSLPQRLLVKSSVKAMFDFVAQYGPLVFLKTTVNHWRVFCVNVADTALFYYAALAKSLKVLAIDGPEEQARDSRRYGRLMLHAVANGRVGLVPNDLNRRLGERGA